MVNVLISHILYITYFVQIMLVSLLLLFIIFFNMLLKIYIFCKSKDVNKLGKIINLCREDAYYTISCFIWISLCNVFVFVQCVKNYSNWNKLKIIRSKQTFYDATINIVQITVKYLNALKKKLIHFVLLKMLLYMSYDP